MLRKTAEPVKKKSVLFLISEDIFHLHEDEFIINTQKLLRLADYLEEVDADKFNMCNWWLTLNHPLENCCKTAGCAIGHACFIPEFQQEGLKLQKSLTLEHGYHCAPIYKEYKGTEAVKAFFNVDNETVVDLFMPSSYNGEEIRSPTAVANRIRSYVKDFEERNKRKN